MSYLFDGATPWNRARLRAVQKHGGTAVSVYIVGTPGGMRCAGRQDVALARSMGLGVLPNWERAADFFRVCTIGQARAAGVEALNACPDLGFPDDGTLDVAFSFDYEVHPADYPAAAARLVAANQGLAGHYRAIAYGPIGFIEYLARNAQPGPHWLMGSTFRSTSQFYPGEVGSPHVAMVQMHDAAGNWLTSPVPGTDINTLTQPERLGAWWPSGNTKGQLSMDQYAALSQQITDLGKRVDAVAGDVWTQPIADPANPSQSHTAASYLTWGNLHAQQARDVARTVVKSVVVDAASVAQDIRDRLLTLLGGHS